MWVSKPRELNAIGMKNLIFLSLDFTITRGLCTIPLFEDLLHASQLSFLIVSTQISVPRRAKSTQHLILPRTLILLWTASSYTRFMCTVKAVYSTTMRNLLWISYP